MDKPNCPLETGLRPCQCDLPRCPECGYTEHDARFEMDHIYCRGTIPPAGPLFQGEDKMSDYAIESLSAGGIMVYKITGPGGRWLDGSYGSRAEAKAAVKKLRDGLPSSEASQTPKRQLLGGSGRSGA